MNLEKETEESRKVVAIIDVNDGAIKNIVTQATSKTTEQDLLLQKVDTALRAQEQAEVSRLDALVAELARNTTEGGHAQALAALNNLQAEVWAFTADTQGHLQEIKTYVGSLKPPAPTSRATCKV